MAACCIIFPIYYCKYHFTDRFQRKVISNGVIYDTYITLQNI